MAIKKRAIMFVDGNNWYLRETGFLGVFGGRYSVGFRLVDDLDNWRTVLQ